MTRPGMDDVWPSGAGPTVPDPALMKIDPRPGAAPYEELELET